MFRFPAWSAKEQLLDDVTLLGGQPEPLLFGNKGGGGSGTTNTQPQAGASSGNFQVFQPGGQQQLAGLYQGLENQFNNLGWSALGALPGGVTAPTFLYPQVNTISNQIAGPNTPGGYSYGYGGAGALDAANVASNQVGNATWPVFGNTINQLGLGNSASQNVYNNAYNPQFQQAIGGAGAGSPYFNQALGGAQTNASIGGNTSGLVSNLLSSLINDPYVGAATDPAQGATAGSNTGYSVPTLQSLIRQGGSLAPYLASEATANNPNLQQLYGQTVPQGQALASGLPGQTNQTLSQLNSLLYGNLGAGPGAIDQIQGLAPQVQAGATGIGNQAQGLYGSLAPQLQGLAGWGQNAAQANTRNLNPLVQQAAGAGAANTQALAPLEQWAQTAAQRNTGNINDIIRQTVPGIQDAAQSVSALGNRGGYGLNAMPEAARQIMQTGLDPQSQLFNQLQQQNLEQSNVANAMAGLGSSPVGAQLNQQNLSNFDINWQNQQLQRQATADQAAQGLFGQTAADAATKAGIQAEGAGLLQQAGQFGLGAENQILQGKLAGGAQAAGIQGQTLQGQLQTQQQQAALRNQILQGKLAGGGQAADILGEQGNLGTSTEAEQLSALFGGNTGALNALTGAGNLGLSGLGQTLQAQLGTASTAGNLLNQTAATGANNINQQLAGVIGSSNIFNQQAQGVGGLASGLGGLQTAGLQDLLFGQGGLSNALQSALSVGTGAAGLAGSSAAAPYNLQQGGISNLLQALQATNQAGNAGAAGLSALTQQQGTGLQNALGALQGGVSMGAQPYLTALTQQQNALNAITQQANFGNQLLTPGQQSLENILPYLNYGQSASLAGGRLGLAANEQNQPNLGAIGSLLNTGLGGGSAGNLLFGSGGLSGALGLNPSTGLLGGLFGGGPGALAGPGSSLVGTALSPVLNASDAAAGFGDVAAALGFAL